MTVQWEEPPVKPGGPHARGRELLNDARQLQANPGQWARIYSGLNLSNATVKASAIRLGRLSAFKPAGSFEATHGQVRDGSHAVWVRYVGGES